VLGEATGAGGDLSAPTVNGAVEGRMPPPRLDYDSTSLSDAKS